MERRSGRSAARRGRLPWRLVLVVALEDRGLLPEPLASFVRGIEREIARELGLPLPSPAPAPKPAPTGKKTEQASVDVAAALAQLATLRVEPEHRQGYERDAWPHWLDADGNCLDAREEVLVAESRKPVLYADDDCEVLAGVWLDPYSGETIDDPSLLDVDHMVPLEEAYESGGYAWDRERRAAYANDLAHPEALIAVTRSANRSKGSKGPEEWLPPLEGYRCRYVADWVAVKARWALAMDESERVAVGNIVRGCSS